MIPSRGFRIKVGHFAFYVLACFLFEKYARVRGQNTGSSLNVLFGRSFWPVINGKITRVSNKTHLIGSFMQLMN
ncbi:hypothetical protein SAMN04488116_0339 [Flagellimonas flava]|uniref:Uncharacterized protein n=1 Tax=Flagellimonas flava TaxID=570519 RepID=A0A1M5I044_9FLAO|nr:hypothetical protein SAMN04488116_0339 [Allomuricauda flava]